MASKEERAAAVVLGVLIGDALGMGSHWLYDETEFTKLYGYQTDYVDPHPNRYHGNLKAGQLTQSGELTSYFVRTLAEKGGWDKDHFTAQWDEMLKDLDGTRKGGKHGWTNKDMCDVYRNRVEGKKDWGPDTASQSTDTTDSIIRAAICAARYYNNIPKMVNVITEQSMMQYKDVGVMSQAVCFGCVIAEIINGHPYDENLSGYLYEGAGNGRLPFATLAGKRDCEAIPEPDGLLLVSTIFNAANDTNVAGSLDARKGVNIYGKACAWFMSLPSAYFCAAKHPKDFEKAVQEAVNAGGQNVARASMVAALVGAECGISKVPERWIKGIEHSSDFVAFAEKIAADASKEPLVEGS
mmetsp:Transcript_6807/g.11995  ORF Transcript_6807/g.11995 Transcript_6807/m.11995 type:complete len:354 (-) Transcript_6807:72-1133(-)